MDTNENCATPQGADTTELRKLQDLVRKLEIQNAELRKSQEESSKGQGPSAKKFGPNGVVQPVNSRRLSTDHDDHGSDDAHDLNESALDEIDLIDVEQLELSDEDSWLYESPTSLTPEQKAISPYKWLRTDVEDPTNTELQAVKRALVSKIEALIQASIVNRNQTQPPLKNHIRSTEPCLRPPLCARLSLGSDAQSIDTRTFTRPKKSLKAIDLPVVDSVSSELPARCDKRSLTNSPSPTSLSADVSDIHTIARLQEECLRQSSPPPSSRRNSVASTSSQRSGKSLLTDHEVPPSANKVMHNIGTDSQHEGSPRALSSRSSVASSSPPISPQGSQYLEETRNATSAIGKRTLPNLPRPYNGVNCSPRGSVGHTTATPQAQTSNVVASNCDTRPATDQSSSRTQRYSMSPLRKVGGIPRSSSPAARLSSFPVRKSSPQIDEINGAAAAVPAAGGLASRIPKPRQARSAIPMRATSYGRTAAATAAEESWKDGCY